MLNKLLMRLKSETRKKHCLWKERRHQKKKKEEEKGNERKWRKQGGIKTKQWKQKEGIERKWGKQEVKIQEKQKINMWDSWWIMIQIYYMSMLVCTIQSAGVNRWHALWLRRYGERSQRLECSCCVLFLQEERH